MRLSIATETGDLRSLSLPPSLDLPSLAVLVASELSLPADSFVLLHNGRELSGASVAAAGVVEDDILLVKVVKRQRSGGEDEVERVRRELLADAGAMQRLARNNPALANAALNNPAEFARLFRDLQKAQRDAEQRRMAELAALEADPFNLEAQRKIEEMIRQEQVQENMELAIEHNPEAFGRVAMLYIPCEVNGHPIKAFVDSGAQATIISPSCAESCNIMRLIDTRFAGIARGVGTARILGRIHSAPMKIGGHFLNCSFTVMEGKGVDLLFGLDNLKRHQAIIDLKDNCLRLYDTEVRFLSEHELPESARWEAAGEGEGEEGILGSNVDGKGKEKPTGEKSTAEKPEVKPNQGLAGPAPPVAPAAAGGSGPKVDEGKVTTLMELGATREEAIRALEAAGGNVDLAVSFIF